MDKNKQIIREVRRRRAEMIKNEAVPRDRAASYIFTVLVLFLVSLAVNKLWIKYTYSDIGSIMIGGLHIHHHFYGALFIVLAAVWGIYYKNEIAVRTASIMLGLGLGFFVDELGEYITPDMNYWWRGVYSITYIIVLAFIVLYIVARSHEKNRRSFLVAGTDRMRDCFTALTKPEIDQLEARIGEEIVELEEEIKKYSYNLKLQIKHDYYKKQLEFIRESRRKFDNLDIELPESRLRRLTHAFFRSSKIFTIMLWFVGVFGIALLADATMSVIWDKSFISIDSVIKVLSRLQSDFYPEVTLGLIFLFIAYGLAKGIKWVWYVAVAFTFTVITVFGVYGFYVSPKVTFLSVLFSGVLLLMLFQHNIRARFLK